MKKIVFIGGGGGVLNIAPGLRDDFDVTAILTTFDDGGSYGRFRRDYKSPLTGDIRRAFAALSTNGLGIHTEYRFVDGEMKGHTLGNILLASVFEHYGNSEKAMENLHDIFAVKGKVLGVSYELAELQAQLKDRSIIRGENIIDEPHSKSHIRIDQVWLDPEPEVAPGVLDAIKDADLILMGPGDVYCSIIPNLLVAGVKKAVNDSKAKKVYFCNRFTKYGQTNGFAASDHLRAIEKYLDSKFNIVVLDQSKLPESVIAHYQNQQEDVVRYDIDNLKKAGYDIVEADLLGDDLVEQSQSDKLKRSKIRYAPDKVNELVQKLCA